MRLSNSSSKLIVAEGLETALSLIPGIVQGEISVWAALKQGSDARPRPDAANAGSELFLRRLSIVDGTVNRLAVIVAKQKRETSLRVGFII